MAVITKTNGLMQFRENIAVWCITGNTNVLCSKVLRFLVSNQVLFSFRLNGR